MDQNNVRQSRRIAQIKIKEEADRRKEEALALVEAEAASKRKKKEEQKVKSIAYLQNIKIHVFAGA